VVRRSRLVPEAEIDKATIDHDSNRIVIKRSRNIFKRESVRRQRNQQSRLPIETMEESQASKRMDGEWGERKRKVEKDHSMTSQ